MQKIFIAAFTLCALLLAGATQSVLAAENATLPVFDYKAHCKDFANKFGGFPYLEETCIAAENNTIKYLESSKRFSGPTGSFEQCVEESKVFGQSYFFFERCFKAKGMTAMNEEPPPSLPEQPEFTQKNEAKEEVKLKYKQIKGNDKQFINEVYEKAYGSQANAVRQNELLISWKEGKPEEIILICEFLREPKTLTEVKILGSMIVNAMESVLKKWGYEDTVKGVSVECKLYKSKKIANGTSEENYLGTVKYIGGEKPLSFHPNNKVVIGVYNKIKNNEKKFIDEVFRLGFAHNEKKARKDFKLLWKGEAENNIFIFVEFLISPSNTEEVEAVGDLTMRGMIKALINMGYSPADDSGMRIACVMYKSVSGLSGKPVMRVYGKTLYNHKTDSSHFEKEK